MGLLSKLFGAAAVAGVWGWFADLRHGDVQGFALRMGFVLAVVLVWHFLALRRQASGGKAR